MAKQEQAEPQSGSLSTMLKKLSKSKPTEAMPQLPEPTFDKYMGGMFKKKKSGQ